MRASQPDVAGVIIKAALQARHPAEPPFARTPSMRVAFVRSLGVTLCFVCANAAVAQATGTCNSGSSRPYEGAPVNGNPIVIAGSGTTTFEAEHFDCGAEGQAYHDLV